MNRRELLKSAGTVAAWSSFWPARALAAANPNAAIETDPRTGIPTAPPPETRNGDMLYRPLGRTGEKVSAIGLGGYHIGSVATEAESVRLIRAAIDHGITFMDNSWDYHEGGSERWMGKALKDGYRGRVFVMSKIDGRTKQAAARQIDESLERFGVDHIDLMQIHEIIRLDDPDRCFAEDGAVAALQDAKKAGKIRFIGFTGHKDPFVHNRMLDIAAKHDFRFDTVQMPLNVLDASFRSFAHLVMPRLVDQGMGVLGMKPMASGAIVRNKIATPTECISYALTLPTSVVITGIESMDVLKQNLRIVKEFKPIAGAEMTALVARTASAAETGKYEQFKTTIKFDATIQYPHWMG